MDDAGGHDDAGEGRELVAVIETAPRTLSDPSPEQIALAEQALGYAAAGQADATKRAYAADWRDFEDWCRREDRPHLPASAQTVLLYLTDRARELKVSTLERRLASIRSRHKAARLPPPAGAGLDRVWAGIRRTHGAPAEKKRALVLEDLRRAVRKLPETTAGVRDRALLLVGFAGGFRRSELAALAIGEGDVRLTFVERGVEVHVRRSKGDQTGQGAVVAIPLGRTSMCAVKALRAWLMAAAISSGPVFRGIDQWGHVGAKALTDRSIALRVKAAVGAAGLDPDVFAAHSLRSGMITSADDKGVSLAVIMRQSRHRKVETVLGYVQAGDRFKNNAAGKLL